MTYRSHDGHIPFVPLAGERVRLVAEGDGALRTNATNIQVRRNDSVLELENPAGTLTASNPAKRLIARVVSEPAMRLYLSAYLSRTIVDWLDRDAEGRYINPKSERPLNPKETDKLFTTRTQETKAGIVGQVVFESDVVWESEPIPKGEYDDDHDLYPGIRDAEKAAYAAKKMAVANLFTNVNV